MQSQVHQRRDHLLKLLQLDTFASVESLSERLGVSPLTVRRDLDALQEAGLVERLHGGARAAHPTRVMDTSEVPIFTREGAQVVEKHAIALAAAALLQKDDVIVIDASTTGRFFARAIPRGLPLTVITYSASLPVQLAGHNDVEVICTGGLLHRKSLCYLGEDAERSLALFHPRRAFLGAKGIDLLAGCTDALLPEVRLKAGLARQVEEVIILADHTKLGNIGLAAFLPLEGVRTLITDEGADEEMIGQIRERGVAVIAAPLVLNGEVL